MLKSLYSPYRARRGYHAEEPSWYSCEFYADFNLGQFGMLEVDIDSLKYELTKLSRYAVESLCGPRMSISDSLNYLKDVRIADDEEIHEVFGGTVHFYLELEDMENADSLKGDIEELAQMFGVECKCQLCIE